MNAMRPKAKRYDPACASPSVRPAAISPTSS